VAETTTRRVPTPRDLAAAAARPGPRAEPPAPYDRQAWEEAVIASGLHVHARALALVLAHHAGESGHLPAGDLQHADRLAEHTGLTSRMTRISLQVLISEGYLVRPSMSSWDGRKGIRPVTLTLPPAGVRTEPPSTGEAR